MPLITDGDIITKKGLDLVAKLIAGKGSLHLTRAAVGDGQLPEGTTKPMIREYASLIHEVQAAEIIDRQFTGNGEALIELMISSEGVAVGFHATELAVFAEEPDTKKEILYAYVSLHEDPTWIRPEGSAVGKIARYSLIVAVGDVEDVVVHLTPGSMVTREEMERHNTSEDSHNAHFQNRDIHVSLAEKEEFRSAGLPFTITLSKSGWARAGNSYRQTVALPNGITIPPNMRPLIAADADTVAQMVDGKITIQACNDNGKLYFNAIGTVPNIDLLIQMTMIKLNRSEGKEEPHNSEPIGSTNGLGTPLPAPVSPASISLSNTSTHTQLSITASWTNPTQDFAGVLVLRKEGALMPSGITDGTVIKNGKESSFKDVDLLEVGKTYTYRWIPYNSAGNYQMSSVIKQITIPTAIPLAPTGVQVSNSTAADAFAVTVSWSAPTDVYRNKFVVVRKSGSASTSVSDGTVVYQGTGTSVRDTGSLTYDVSYYYTVFAVNTAGQASTAGSGVSKSITIAPIVPQQVTNLKLEDASANTVGYRVRVSCNFPKDVNAYQWVVLRKAGSKPTSNVDGTKVHEDRIAGSGDSFIDSVSYSSQPYYYRVFVLNQKGQLSTAEASAAITLTANRPGGITNLTANDVKGTTTVDFDLPTVVYEGKEVIDKYLTGYRVLQKEGSDPANANDGTVISEGTIGAGTTQKHITCQRSGQPNGVTLHIVVFVKNHAGTYFLSFGQGAVVTPTLKPEFRYNGEYEFLEDGANHWRIKFFTSGVFTLLAPAQLDVDVFLVGGGGSGGLGGGGGGYTKTYRKVTVQKEAPVTVMIGAGGINTQDGGTTSFGNYEALGGVSPKSKPGIPWPAAGDGGSGGGGYMGGSGNRNGRKGGSNGTDGEGRGSSGSDTGGKGQITTTREFEEPDGEMYSGGGGGDGGSGGDGGYGGGAYSQDAINGIGGKAGKTTTTYNGTDMSGNAIYSTYYGGGGGGGYGGGGGAGAKVTVITGGAEFSPQGGDGFQGIAIIRDAH